MPDVIVRLQDVEMRRNEISILKGISWQIERGQHWALLGANGSGKTSLLKLITGYEWPTEGEIEVLGERFGDTNLPELRTRIGWVSSSLGEAIPNYDTAAEVVESGYEASLGLWREFTDSERKRARECLHLLGAGNIEGSPWGVLSQGERQRVLIARALVHKPELLILDEPCAGLDPAAREHFLSDLSSMLFDTQAPTLIFVTHHIEEIGPWITHVLLLKSGQALGCGPTATTLTSENLGRALGRECSVERHNGRYYLKF